MNKRIIVYQVVACVFIMSMVGLNMNIENKTLKKVVDAASKEVMRELTIDDVKAAGVNAIEVIKNTPSTVVSAIVAVNEASEYGQPMDTVSTEAGEIKNVHAVLGGMVVSSGIDSTIGMYIKIQHEDAVSVYGNLCDIRVAESERVKRGEIIGSFDPLGGTDFFYNLETLD